MKDDTTRATARLPGLEIEIVHRRLPGAEAEQISINLQAVPSFEAFGQFFETANLFAAWAQAAPNGVVSLAQSGTHSGAVLERSPSTAKT
jgi:hypothetical protein